MRRPLAAALGVLLLSSCGFARRHEKVTTVSITTTVLAAGIGVPLSQDCNTPTSQCSGGYTAAVFGIGAVVGLGLGLLVVQERDRGGERTYPPPRELDVLDAGVYASCGRAGALIRDEVRTSCADPARAVDAIHRGCSCTRGAGGAIACVVDTAGTCAGTAGAPLGIAAAWGEDPPAATAAARAAAARACDADGAIPDQRVRCSCGDAPALGCFCVAAATCGAPAASPDPSAARGVP